MKAALIGYGRWGKILEPYIRKYFELDYIASRGFLMPESADVVFIATPPETHYSIARDFICAGKHVFVEKPMCTTAGQCADLIKLAEQKGVKLYTDYLEMTAPSRQFMVRLLPEIGEIRSFYAYTGQHSKVLDIVWQLLPHQLSMLSLFINLNQRFKRIKHWWDYLEISFDKGVLISDLDADRNKIFRINGTEGTLTYNKNWGVVLNDTISYFDENNNIDYAIQDFIAVINGKESNTQIALKITEIIENLLKK